MARVRIFEGHHRVGINRDAVIVELPSGEKCWAHVNIYTMRTRVRIGKVWIVGNISVLMDGTYKFYPSNYNSERKLKALRTWKRQHALTMKNGHYISGRKAA